jgi:polysaccharide pyruvyl transferase WcaK-like protein
MQERKCKALLVGDHRDTTNWGGRGQPIALSNLVAKRFTINGVITGREVTSVDANDGYVGNILPHELIKFLFRIRGRVKLVNWYLGIEEWLGTRDVITEVPARSADDLLRYRRKRPGLEDIYRKVSDCDLMIINGEGSGIFTTPFRRDFFFYLMMVELANRLGKKVFYVNAILSDCPETGRNDKNFESARRTLSKCAAVLVRDPESLELVEREMPEVSCRYIPDALFTWFPIYENHARSLPADGDFLVSPPERDEYFGKLDFSRPYICLGGSAAVAADPEKASGHYIQLWQRLRELKVPVYLTPSCSGDRFLEKVAAATGAGIVSVSVPILMAGAVLANASLFVSGRFHASILASLGGTPCIFLESHSHKMRSLQRTLEYEESPIFPAFPGDDENSEILDLANHYLDQGEDLRDRIRGSVRKRCAEAETLASAIDDFL